MVACENWDIISELACVWSQARRTVADGFVHKSIITGLQSRVNELVKAYVPPPVVKRPPPFLRSGTKQKSVAAARFFLTEEDTPADDQDDNGSVGTMQSSSRQQQHGTMARSSSTVGRHLSAGSGKLSRAISESGLNKPKDARSRDRPLRSSFMAPLYEPLIPEPEPVKVGKVYDPEDENGRKVIEMHRARVAEMEAEHQRRVIALEQVQCMKQWVHCVVLCKLNKFVFLFQSRKASAMTAAIAQSTEEVEKQEKLSAKAAFLAKLEEDSKNARKMAALKKAKQAFLDLRRELQAKANPPIAADATAVEATGDVGHGENKPSKPRVTKPVKSGPPLPSQTQAPKPPPIKASLPEAVKPLVPAKPVPITKPPPMKKPEAKVETAAEQV